ncbi:hypothetical protein NW755_012525 [Fusarium falciforme]|uniref:Apple domain-containing protein n=1 Tax=Fusarium falciforme TaxID=195108 RepID=A0A9W8QX68_9HYPO|nr:hypothetical protein NW755_012525 [Fusarium falciforme]
MRFVGTFAALALAGSVSAGPCKPGSSSTLSATTSSASATSTSGHGSGPIVNEIEGGDFRRRSNSPSGISNFVVEGQGSYVEGGGYTGGGSTEQNCASLEAASTQPGPGKRDVGQYAAISQQLTNLQAGSAYTVQFFYAVQSSAQSGACRIEASFGSNVFTSTPYFPSSNTPSSWTSSTVSTNIQVTQGQMSFVLTCVGGGSAQVYIDSIFVSNQVTPETIGDADLVFDAAGTETSQLPSATSAEAATETNTEATTEITSEATSEAATEAATDATSVASTDAASSDSATEATTEASTETTTEEGNTLETVSASESTSEEQGTSATKTATETDSEESTSVVSTASETTVEKTTSAAATSTETSAEETASTTETGAEETTTAQETTFSTTTLETSTEAEETTSETLTPTSTTPTSTQLICPSGVSAPGGCYVPDEVPGTPTCFQVGFVSGAVDVQYQDMKTPVQEWQTCASACADKPGCLSFGYDDENPNRYCALYASKLDWSFAPMSRGLTWTEVDCIKCIECEDAPIPTETGVAEAGDPPVQPETQTLDTSF